MLVTLALLVFMGAILVLFSDEFISTFKKLFAIRGAALFLPLFVASWLVYTFDFWWLWVLFYLREMIQDALTLLIRIMPFQHGAQSFALVLLLTFVSVVPVRIIDLLSRRKNFKGYPHIYVTSTVIWVISVVLLIIT